MASASAWADPVPEPGGCHEIQIPPDRCPAARRFHRDPDVGGCRRRLDHGRGGRVAGEHLRAQAGSQGHQHPSGRGDPGYDRSGQVGRELAQAVRRLQAHRAVDEDAVRRPRRQRSLAAGEDRQGPVAQADVPRLRVLDRLPRPARPRLHAAGPGEHAAPDQAADRFLPALPRLGDAALSQAGRRRRHQGIRNDIQDPVQGPEQAIARHGPRIPGELSRLP